MNITINSQILAAELRLLNRVVPNKPALPILSNVLIDAGFTLQFYATDLEIGFSTSCQAVITEPGKITLPAKKLLDLLEQLPNADVKITLEKGHVRIVCGEFKSRLQTLPAEHYPTPTTASDPITTFTNFHTMVERVRYALSDKSKYVVNGALLKLQGTMIALVGTDARRLSVTTGTGQNAASECVIPAKTLDALSLLDSEIVFSADDRHLFFASGDRLLTSRVYDGKFPAYERIIPRDNDKRAVVDRSLFMSAIKRIGLVSDTNQAIYLALEPGALVLTSSSIDVGDALERIALDYSGQPVKLCVNWQFVLDFLQVARGSTITMDFKDAATPLLLTDGDAFINVVMLLRA